MKHHKLRLVILCLLLAAALTVGAFAASPCVVSIQGGSTAKPGQSVTFNVEITGNPGFTNFDFGIEYDRSVLTLDSIQTKQALSLPDGSAAESPYLCGGMAVVNLQYIDWENPSALIGYISAIHTQNVKKDGTLFTVTFTVKESAAGGSTSIAIKPFAFADEQQNTVSASYSPAVLTIGAPADSLDSSRSGARFWPDIEQHDWDGLHGQFLTFLFVSRLFGRGRKQVVRYAEAGRCPSGCPARHYGGTRSRTLCAG